MVPSDNRDKDGYVGLAGLCHEYTYIPSGDLLVAIIRAQWLTVLCDQLTDSAFADDAYLLCCRPVR